MKPLPHRYEATLTGGPTGHANLASDGLPNLPTAPPVDFGGPGDAWSPEHMLLGSVATCFLFTFRAVARASQLQFNSVDLDVSGTVDRVDGVTRFTEIVLRARAVVAAGTDPDRARRVMERSERACLVSRSLESPIRFEPEVLVGDLWAV